MRAAKNETTVELTKGTEETNGLDRTVDEDPLLDSWGTPASELLLLYEIPADLKTITLRHGACAIQLEPDTGLIDGKPGTGKHAPFAGAPTSRWQRHRPPGKPAAWHAAPCAIRVCPAVRFGFADSGESSVTNAAAIEFAQSSNIPLTKCKRTATRTRPPRMRRAVWPSSIAAHSPTRPTSMRFDPRSASRRKRRNQRKPQSARATRLPRTKLDLRLERLEDRSMLATFTAGDIAVLQLAGTGNNTTGTVEELAPSGAAQTPALSVAILRRGPMRCDSVIRGQAVFSPAQAMGPYSCSPPTTRRTPPIRTSRRSRHWTRPPIAPSQLWTLAQRLRKTPQRSLCKRPTQEFPPIRPVRRRVSTTRTGISRIRVVCTRMVRRSQRLHGQGNRQRRPWRRRQPELHLERVAPVHHESWHKELGGNYRYRFRPAACRPAMLGRFPPPAYPPAWRSTLVRE